MNYDNLYEKDYIVSVPDEGCTPIRGEEFYCDVRIQNDNAGNEYVEEQCYFDSAQELIDYIAGGLEERGYQLDEKLVKECIKKEDLETFFDTLDNMFKAGGIEYYIEFRHFTEEEVKELQKNNEDFVFCRECAFAKDCELDSYDTNDEEAGCVDGYDKYSYEYWNNEIMDKKLERLEFDEKYEMYLHWYNEQKKE